MEVLVVVVVAFLVDVLVEFRMEVVSVGQWVRVMVVVVDVGTVVGGEVEVEVVVVDVFVVSVVVEEMEVLVVVVFVVGVLVEVMMELVWVVQRMVVELVEEVLGVKESMLVVVVEEAEVKITSAPLCVWFWRSTTPKRRATWLCSWSPHRSALFNFIGMASFIQNTHINFRLITES